MRLCLSATGRQTQNYKSENELTALGRFLLSQKEGAMPIQNNAVVTANEISVRTLPTVKGAYLKPLFKGAQIEVIEGINDEYAKVLIEAYAYSDKGKHIKPLVPVPAPEPALPAAYQQNGIVTCNTKISLRAGRGTGFPQVEGHETLKKGEPVQILDPDLDEDYIHVRLPDLTEGYAYGDEGRWVQFLPPAPADPIAEKVKATLDIIKSCAGGKYVYGAQGHKITTELIKKGIASVPDYYTGNRGKMLLAVAAKAEAAGEWKFPGDYCWDCSGLWWYAADKLDLFGTVKDSTAHGMYHGYCIPINKNETRAGDCAFYQNSSGRITHMAVIGENGVVYEAMSGYVGVVQQDSILDRTAYRLPGVDNAGAKFSKSAWNVFGRPKCFA
jgi:hypothetical protein